MKKDEQANVLLSLKNLYRLFTLLSLHAMAGPEISGVKMKLVRNREDLKPEYIWSCIYQESGEIRQSFLTLRNCELFRKSVKASHFFGREEELYDLKEMFFNSGKYLISGIGGIGKTELMRQLVSWMEQEEVKWRIAEPTWNLARVYRALGNEEKEDIYLKAAVEGFRECYPPEHPKRIAAEQRLKEHQGE